MHRSVPRVKTADEPKISKRVRLVLVHIEPPELSSRDSHHAITDLPLQHWLRERVLRVIPAYSTSEHAQRVRF